MANSTTSAAGTVITIPANKHWVGHVVLSATLTVAPGGNASTQYPSIDVSGASASWDNGSKVVTVALAAPAVGVASLIGTAVTATVCSGTITIQTRENPVSLVLNYGAGVTAIGAACGETL